MRGYFRDWPWIVAIGLAVVVAAVLLGVLVAWGRGRL